MLDASAGTGELENPLRSGFGPERVPAPCAFVIFGASGDLARRKLVPALYDLFVSRLLPASTSIVGFGATDLSADQFRARMQVACAEFARTRPLDEALWREFASRLDYVPGRIADPSSMRHLLEKLAALDRERRTRGNRIYYLAVPPSLFGPCATSLGHAGLVERATEPSRAQRYTRIVVEKPFGHDLASAEALDRELHGVFDESQIFRVDHYLGKETVQNLAAFRFGNEIFEPLWNRSHVDHVQITVAESIGVEGRGRFYEEAGATRDVVQNHMLQLLSLTAMEPPAAFDADSVRDEKIKVLRSLRPLVGTEALACSVRGQYGPGIVCGENVPGYRHEPGVAKDSKVETYVALKLEIDNWRFAGVPFYLRTGKRLPKRVTEISLTFKRVPHAFFASETARSLAPDLLAFGIQPEEGISLRFMTKVPGPTMTLRPVNMSFRFGTAFGASTLDAYERIVLDAMLGDATIFARSDEVLAAWKFVTPVLEAWAAAPAPDFPNYAAGTWGPAAAEALIARDARQWRNL
jgi:glucose-6-phosphate 1-dehydrogenase